MAFSEETAGRIDVVELACRNKQTSPFRYYRTSPEVIRLAVMRYVRSPLSLRQLEDLCHETVRYWWNRFGLKLLLPSGLGFMLVKVRLWRDFMRRFRY